MILFVKQRMPATRTLRRSVSLASVLWLLGLGACTSVLGIEDLHDGPRPGTGGDENNGGSSTPGAGKSGVAGSKDNPSGGASANGGGNANGGSNQPGAGTSNQPSGGGGAETTGDAGAAGRPSTDDPTVRGHLIDAYGHKLANVAVQIGDTLVSTDDKGAFVVPDVPAMYDVSLDFEYEQYSTHRSVAWVFQGLTRRDPTLQVRRGLPVRSGNIVVAPKNVTLDDNQTISVAIGGSEGNTELTGVGANGVETSASWEGGATTQETAHGLYFQQDADDLPTSYLGYDTTLVALSDVSGKAQISLDLTKTTLDSGALKGTATSGGGTDRANLAFLRFDTGAFLKLVDDSAGPNTFTYLMPSLAKSTITVAASEGDAYYGAFAVAHADGLSVTSKPVLAIPTPATLTSPAAGLETVTSATKFSFQSPASNPGPFVVSFENVDLNGPFQFLFVVTAEKQLTIPEVVGGGFGLNHEQSIQWRVETNGKFTSVDEMAGPEGFLDSFDQYGFEGGMKEESGEYTISSSRLFKLAK